MTLVLSLFPGIGLLDRAFEEEGFCVVRGPDVLWGGDIRCFQPPAGVFDGVIGGPPCQAFSRMRHMVLATWGEGSLAENLIPEFERCISEARPTWFLMENVPAAPLPVVSGYIVQDLLLNNRWVPDGALGAVQNRVRRFSFGTTDGRRLYPEMALFESPEKVPAVTASACVWVPVKLGGSGKPKSTYVAERKGRPESKHSEAYFRGGVAAQGLPPDFDLPGFTLRGKIRALGNGVPLPMGRAIARAVRRAMERRDQS